MSAFLVPGNPHNRPLGRAADLMWRNLGGKIPAVNNCGVMEYNVIQNVVPESQDELPPGWKGMNEEYGFKKDEDVLIQMSLQTLQPTQFSPGGYRAFQKSGHGGIARRLGVKGVPGPKNWLDYMVPGFWASGEDAVGIFLLPEMAIQLQQAGMQVQGRNLRVALEEELHDRRRVPDP